MSQSKKIKSGVAAATDTKNGLLPIKTNEKNVGAKLIPETTQDPAPVNRKRGTDARDKHIGLQIRTHRTIQGLSQQELAKQLKISFQQLQKYEKGVNRTTTVRLLDIAAILKCNIKLLLPPEDDHSTSNTSLVLSDQQVPDNESSQAHLAANTQTGGPRNRELLELNRYFNLVPKRQTRRQFINLLRAMALTNEDEYMNGKK